MSRRLKIITSPSDEKNIEKHNNKSDISDDKLEDLMREWSKVKRQLYEIEEREKSIKSLVADIMNEKDTESIYTDNYKVTKKIQQRSTVSQKDLPEEIWKKYSKVSTFPVYYLKRL